MGIFFDLMQQEELEKQQIQADTLGERVEILEQELKKQEHYSSRHLRL